MGRDVYSVDGLLPPLQRLGERYVNIPAGQTLFVHNPSESPRLIYFLGDSVSLELADGSRVAIQSGDALAVTQPMPLRYRSPSPRRDACNHILSIRFGRTAWGSTRALRDRGSMPARLAELMEAKLGPLRHFPSALTRPGAADLLRLIRAEGERGSAHAAWKVSGLAVALVADLLELPSVSRPEVVIGAGAAAAEHARHYLLQHFHRDLRLAQIAWEVRLSGAHLARQFKQHFGVTIFTYLDRVRVDHAKQLLLSTELPLAVVASRCGYSSVNLLCRHFKAVSGQSPQKYRLTARMHEGFSRSDFTSATR